jgi:hypothetical protein
MSKSGTSTDRAAVFLACLLLAGCGTNNLDDVKAQACKRWAEVGYKCVGYEGFQWGLQLGTYGGAKVWHSLEREAAPGIIYTGHVQKWGDEYHMYGPTAVDAIKPSLR